MSGFDIFVGLLLVYAAWRGFRDGVLVQLGGIAGLVAGVWVAFRYGTAFGLRLRLEGATASVVGFIAILLGVLLAVALVGRLARRIFRIAGLGPLDAVGGLLLGVVKMGLALSVLLLLFEPLNEQAKWIDRGRFEQAALYRPVREAGTLLFPYLVRAKDKWMETNE